MTTFSPVEEIKGRLDIVDIINEHTPLKAAGQNWKARCPFHNEKTPSFMVSRDRGSWHCFGCGRGGDVFSFIQEMEGIDFPEALRLLAKRAGVELKARDPKLQTQRMNVMDVLRWVSRYYQEVLKKSKDAEAARQYVKARGLTDETIEDFGIGFAPNAWDQTFQALRKKGFSEDDIFQAGQTIKKDRGAGYYDRFRGRIMFPISDVHGSIVGFTGRIVDALVDPKAPVPAKYVNSPQTIVYNKSLVLYALDQAKQAIKKADQAVLVEGQMDTIASHQAGVRNVVAGSGTALTLDQVQLLKRFTSNILFAFDQDAAGAQASVRGVEQALLAGLNVLVVRLPFGKDPDEVIQKDPAGWRQAIAQAVPAMDYFFEQALAGKNMANVTDKKIVAKTLLPMIAKIANPVEQAHYLQQLGDRVNVEPAILRQSLPKPAATRPASGTAAKMEAAPSRPVAEPPPPNRFRVISEQLLALLLREPRFMAQVVDQLMPEAFVGDDLQALYKTLVVWYTEHRLVTRENLVTLSQHAASDYQELLHLLALLGDKEYPEAFGPEIEQHLVTMMSMLKRHYVTGELRRIESELRQAERQPSGRTADVASLLEQFHTLTEQLKNLPS